MVSGYATSAQAEFDKFFVKIICAAFAFCLTAPMKNILSFEAHRKYENKALGECLC
jgi:hypothetical protein